MVDKRAIKDDSLSEKQLQSLYKKYIDKNIYRVSSAEYTKDILKNGLNPKKDPFKKIRPKIEQLYDLVLELENKGHILTLDWHGMNPKGSFVVKVSRNDLDEPFIDFTAYWKDVVKFRRQFKGGAITTNIKDLCQGILKLKVKLTDKQAKLVNELLLWTKQKQSFKNTIIIIKGSSRSLESLKFQHYFKTHAKNETERYWESPYGSFNHFKKVIKKYGFSRYEPFLKGEKIAHLRFITKIPAKEIRII